MDEETAFAALVSVDASAREAAQSTCQALTLALGGNLVAAYLHGSAALGGYRRDRSDLDILTITAERLTDFDVKAVVAAVSRGTYPAGGLEMTLLTKREAALPEGRTPRFQLHVATRRVGGAIRAVDGRERAGDRDLVLHFAVCRAAGVTLVGPPPDQVLASVPAGDVLLAMIHEVEWAATAPLEYLVLTAARAWLFAATDRLASKIVAGEWAAGRYPEPEVIRSALTVQRGGDAELDSIAAGAFARHVVRVIHGRIADTRGAPAP